MKKLSATLLATTLLALGATAQTLTPIYSFTNFPAHPYGTLLQGPDGDFYGTSMGGVSSGDFGAVFKVTTNGTVTTLVAFVNSNGAHPYAGLILGGDGSFYGTTYEGGSIGDGTVFKVTTNGEFTTVANFDGFHGAHPYAGLTLGSDGSFYGTTYYGGSRNYGTVFKMTTNGTLTVLVSFANTNGANPRSGLAVGSDGNFYGTTYQGVSGAGTVFKITTNGTLTTLINCQYPYPYGENPEAGLILGGDGSLYGTACHGGTTGNGAVFKVTTNGTATQLASCDSTGLHPYAGLTLGNDGNFYGATVDGGSGANGVIYRLVLPPVITVPPASGFAPSGSNFFLTITASSSTRPTYQWIFNGTALTGATNGSLTVSNVSLANVGAYQVVAANSFGSVTSQVATLTMLVSGSSFPPQVSAASVTGSSFQFSWNTVNTYPPVGYQVQSTTNLAAANWVHLGGVLTGTNGALGFTNSLGADPRRFYRVLLVQ